jgi:hypothetical protein
MQSNQTSSRKNPSALMANTLARVFRQAFARIGGLWVGMIAIYLPLTTHHSISIIPLLAAEASYFTLEAV